MDCVGAGPDAVQSIKPVLNTQPRRPHAMHTDRIQIVDLGLSCIIGINPEEQTRPQDIVLTITLFTDLRKAGASDDIRDTVNYKTLKQKIMAAITPRRFQLIETVAAETARICLADPKVEKVVVRVEKPGALRYARTVAVEIERSREPG